MKEELKIISYKVFPETYLSETRIQINYKNQKTILYYHLLQGKIYEDEKENWQYDEYTYEEVEELLQNYFTKERKKEIMNFFIETYEKQMEEIETILEKPYDDAIGVIMLYNTLFNESLNAKKWMEVFDCYTETIKKRKEEIQKEEVTSVKPLYRGKKLQELLFTYKGVELTYEGPFSDLEMFQHVKTNDIEEICPLCGLKLEDDLGESLCLYFNDTEEEIRKKIMYSPHFRVRGMILFPEYYR